jgi:hypothetical protein
MELDIQLLSRWFHKGYSSREMAMFLTMEYVQNFGVQMGGVELDAEAISDKYESFHDEVISLIYMK